MTTSINLGTLIHKLDVRNFRSFGHLHLDLGPLNLLIGANASGKSNVLLALRFLRDLADDGLDEAVSNQGGIELMTNARHRDEPVTFQISYSEGGRAPGLELLFDTLDHQQWEPQSPRYTYDLTLAPESRTKYRIVTELLNVHFSCGAGPAATGDSNYLSNNGVLQIKRNGTALSWFAHLPDLHLIRPSPVFERVSSSRKTIDSASSIFDRDTSILDFTPSAFLKDIPIFEFDPDLARDATFTAGKSTLDEDGENLPVVLNRLFEDAENRETFLQLVRSMLPYVSRIDVEMYSDMTALLRVSETYTGSSLPANAISSGTIDIAALITAIYFEPSPVIAFEEPERYIHASVIARLANLLKSRSKVKQFLLTTHNPILISELSDATVYALYRDKRGYSRAFRPHDDAALQTFFDNEIGLAELNRDNLLHE